MTALARHGWVLAGRSLAKSARNPGAAVNAIVTPTLFMVLFLYLFGGAVSGSTGDYLQYLFPGILVMGAGLAGLLSTGTNLAADLKKGVTDRLRSMPIARVAPLLGSVLADVARYLVAVAALFAVAYLLGFRAQGGPAAALAAAGLAIVFGFALSWVAVCIGALARDESAVLAFSFIALLPLQLGTSLAAPVATLPGWLGAWAGVNPVTHAMDACRALLTGVPAGAPVTATLLWSAGLVAVFCPLAVLAYTREG